MFSSFYYSEALRFLEEKLEPLSLSERQETIDSVIENISKQDLKSPLIEKNVVDTVLQSLQSSSNDDGILFKVFEAFELIRYTYK